MHGYFEKMPLLAASPISPDPRNRAELEAEENRIEEAARTVRQAGTPTEIMHEKGFLTVWERIGRLVDAGSFLPLHTLLNPAENTEGTTGIVDGLARISGKWCVVAGFDNKVLSGAWLPGQSENQLRVTELARRLNIPLVWLVNCSGVKLSEQHRVFGGRRGTGSTFYRHADMALTGLPVIAGVWGTNPAGGGYQTMSTSWIAAHKDAVVAAGGALAGQAIHGPFDAEAGARLVALIGSLEGRTPGTAATHGPITGFFSKVCPTEEAVLDALRERVAQMPAYAPDYFRVTAPEAPAFEASDLYSLLPRDPSRPYSLEACLARLTDGSRHLEYRPDYGPEVYCGMARLSGLPVGIVGNRQDGLPAGYPDYARGRYAGRGGGLYREGLIKMSEFVALCGRDRMPVVWFQDTLGLDVSVEAEQAEILALGQTLMYGIEQADVPMMLVVLRRGLVAGHYIMGGPIANASNAFTLGTAATGISVMPGDLAAALSYGRKLVSEARRGVSSEGTLDRMNAMSRDISEHAQPLYCARAGLVDEIVRLDAVRAYLLAFAESAYQNPGSFCPHHHRLLPRVIRG